MEGFERQAAAAPTVRPISPALESLDLPRPRAAPPDQSLWSPERVRAFAASIVSAGTPDGVLRIPSLQLEVPIYPGTGALNLNRGAAHIEGTAALHADGNIGLAAHRDGFFRPLKDIAIDAVVVLESGVGARRFRVVEIGIVRPKDVHVLAPTIVPSVTLVTCYPFYFVGDAPLRYVVRAELAGARG